MSDKGPIKIDSHETLMNHLWDMANSELIPCQHIFDSIYINFNKYNLKMLTVTYYRCAKCQGVETTW